jgi:aminoglycoside phosphotransferase (APT) family kinase protein
MAWRPSGEEFRGLRGVDLAALGIPSETEYLQMYLRTTGFEAPRPQDWEFYIVFNLFRAAAIFQGVMARAVAGNASSARALETGRKARPTAEFAWKLVEALP